MSHSKRSSFDSLSSRFRDSLGFTTATSKDNKPDFRELDLGSPVSTLPGFNANGGTSSGSSSSGSVSGKSSTAHLPKKPENGSGGHSGELSETSPPPPGSVPGNSHRRLGHRRSISAGAALIYSGSSFSGATSNYGRVNGASSSVSSNPSISSVLPSGNICPSGKILKTMAPRVPNKTDTLVRGTGNYGHGSIMRGGISGGVKMGNTNPEEVKRAGNEMYKRGNFVEALALYDKAISMSPDNAAYRSNRAAALTAVGRLGEAVRECEEAVRLDSGYGRAHQRLASLYLRLGQPDNARHHLCFPGQQPDPTDLQKLLLLEKHIVRCADAQKIGDWKSVLREIDAAIAIGADSSSQLVACKAEALLKLHEIKNADSYLSSALKLKHPSSQTGSFGMISEAYVLFVQAQVEMALGRFENAVSAAEKARLIDHSNVEISTLLNNVKIVAKARSRGNDFFSAGRYAEACSAYGEGLRYDSSNYILYCNRAVCWSKLGLWEKSVEDCNQALKIQPNYTKALLRRAASNGKLGRWAEAVKDYEVLRRELPGDNEVAESLHSAQVALMKSQVCNVKYGGEAEEVSSLDRFKGAISSPGGCGGKLSSSKSREYITVPTFNICRNGDTVKEMIRPNHQFLEGSVRNYIL